MVAYVDPGCMHRPDEHSQLQSRIAFHTLPPYIDYYIRRINELRFIFKPNRRMTYTRTITG